MPIPKVGALGDAGAIIGLAETTDINNLCSLKKLLQSHFLLPEITAPPNAAQ